eukprot:scaffold2054_cov19-Tisochrysis_lutea.AAC.3
MPALTCAHAIHAYTLACAPAKLLRISAAYPAHAPLKLVRACRARCCSCAARAAPGFPAAAAAAALGETQLGWVLFWCGPALCCRCWDEGGEPVGKRQDMRSMLPGRNVE